MSEYLVTYRNAKGGQARVVVHAETTGDAARAAVATVDTLFREDILRIEKQEEAS